MLRGTIEELDPKGSVTIVLSNGDRRTVRMLDVEYAGPNRGESGRATSDATKPAVTVTAEEAKLELSSPQPHVTFHVKMGMARVAGTAVGATSRGTATVSYSAQVASFSRLCTAPCQAELASGSYVFALSTKDGEAIEADPITVRGSVGLRGEIVSNQWIRTAGVVVVISSLAVGLYLATTASKTKEGCVGGGAACSEADSGRLLLGGVVAATGTLIGVLLARTGDDATIRVVPGVAMLRSKDMLVSTRPVTELYGASLDVTF